MKEENTAVRIYNEIERRTQYKANKIVELIKIAYKFWKTLKKNNAPLTLEKILTMT
jgi:hypothetical protein